MKNRQLYKYSGKIDNSSIHWEFIPSENKEEMTYNPAEGYYPDKGGKLFCPKISPAKEFRYYSLSFEAECSEDCHWAVIFYDINGEAIVSDIYASIYTDQNIYKVVVYSRENAVSLQPFFQSINGVQISNLAVEEISDNEAAELCDELYATIPPLSYVPLKNRFKLLPKTLGAFKTGGELRVVMLGDSIVNDTFNSNFQVLIKRNYPRSNIKWICSVRGSTGCWFYQEQENFQEYVIDLKPDILIIGGISQNDDIAAIEKVVNMTRQQLDCEIALASAPFGKEEKIEQDNRFAQRERLLAEKMNIEFIDIRKEWIEYLQNCKKTMRFFYRDVIHGNDRGKQIVGRILSENLKKE